MLKMSNFRYQQNKKKEENAEQEEYYNSFFENNEIETIKTDKQRWDERADRNKIYNHFVYPLKQRLKIW